MTVKQLGKILKRMYESSRFEKTTMVHLFGIKYAKEIRENKITPNELLRAADMPKSYQAEINKGINLAKYVDIK